MYVFYVLFFPYLTGKGITWMNFIMLLVEMWKLFFFFDELSPFTKPEEHNLIQIDQSVSCVHSENHC